MFSHCTAYQHGICSSFRLSSDCGQKQKLQNVLHQNAKGPASDLGLQEKNRAFHLCTSTHVWQREEPAKHSASYVCSGNKNLQCFFSLSFLLLLLYLVSLIQLHDNLLKMQEDFALPHTVNALSWAACSDSCPYQGVIYDWIRLAAPETSTDKTLITGNRENQGHMIAS